MKVIAYTRATDGDEQPLDAQERAIERWAATNGHSVVAIIPDAGASAAEALDTRVGFAEVLARLKEGDADAIVVVSLDRVARDPVRQELMLVEVRRGGFDILSADPADDGALADPPADRDRALIRRVLDAAGEHESAMRDLRVLHRLGRAELSGEEIEQAALARIEQLAEHGIPVREIGRTLSDEGFSPHHSHVWDRAGLERIVARLRRSR